MTSNPPHVSIIILNWNGAADTIECLETVLKTNYANKSVILIDNNSTDDSLAKIHAWALGEEADIPTQYPDFVSPLVEKPVRIVELTRQHEKSVEMTEENSQLFPSTESLLLVRNHENSGFALGNNLGIEIARSSFNSAYYLLLNNDTVVERDTIPKLIDALETNPEVGAATAAIFHYSDRSRIANIGGRITFFAKRQYYTSLSPEKFKPVTFATGCALLVRRSVFERVGLLSGEFFFGEEDFEFSWRLRKNGIPIVCVTESRVYHKVGVSSDKLLKQDLRRKFLYVFNRVIDMKMNLSSPLWHLWRILLYVYAILWLTLRNKATIPAAIRFVKELRRYTNQYDDARKSTVETILKEVQLE